MSLEHSPARAQDAAIQGGAPAPPEADLAYWNALIDETAGGDFLGLTPRTMQAMRQRGGGPPYIVVSARCLRYTRRRLKIWADKRVSGHFLELHLLLQCHNNTSRQGGGHEMDRGVPVRGHSL